MTTAQLSLESQPAAASPVATLKVLTFRVGGLLMALELPHVREVVRVSTVTSTPHASAAVAGMIRLRGAAITVVRVDRLLALPAGEDAQPTRIIAVTHGEETVGLMVEAVEGIVELKPEELREPSQMLVKLNHRCIQGIATRAGELLVVVRFEELLSDERLTGGSGTCAP